MPLGCREDVRVEGLVGQIPINWIWMGWIITDEMRFLARRMRVGRVATCPSHVLHCERIPHWLAGRLTQFERDSAWNRSICSPPAQHSGTRYDAEH